MPLLLAVGMTGESTGAFQQVTRSKIGKPSLLRINELLASNRTGKLDDGSWLLSDPSALAGAPPASEDPTGLAPALSGFALLHVPRSQRSHIGNPKQAALIFARQHHGYGARGNCVPA